MDEARDPLNEIDEEIRRALSVAPSADFVARTCAHVHAQTPAPTSKWMPMQTSMRWPMAGGAIAASLLLAFWIFNEQKAAPAPRSLVQPLASTPSRGAGELLPAASGRDVADAAPVERMPAVPVAQSVERTAAADRVPEVLIAASERRGLRMLIAAIDGRRIDGESVETQSTPVSNPIEFSTLSEPAALDVPALSGQ